MVAMLLLPGQLDCTVLFGPERLSSYLIPFVGARSPGLASLPRSFWGSYAAAESALLPRVHQGTAGRAPIAAHLPSPGSQLERRRPAWNRSATCLVSHPLCWIV